LNKLDAAELISSGEICKLYKTPQTNIEDGLLKYTCSECAGKIAFHRKLKLHKGEHGYYVIARGTKCYINNLAHKWFLK
jgi:hypothetical protein